ncbi:MAG TPA: porin family protein [Chitinophagaceae bacterium]|nr:porin family protein [Chitinophagaceae bacterium]
MKKGFFFFLISLPTLGFAQLGIGVKAGLNFANVTNPAGINANSHSGYMIGAYFSPKPKKLFGFRSEIMLSRQGYDYKTNNNTGTVNLDYLLLPQLITINFTKRFEIHAGGQLAFLLNAKADSSNNNGGSVFDYFSRFDYGIVGGLQVSPISGLFIGARINIGLNDINNESGMMPVIPDFFPRKFVKNNVVQLYAGWRF